MKIVGIPQGEINIKRFYVRGISLVGKCCHCDAAINQEVDGDGISYPILNKDYVYSLICPSCQEGMWVNLEFKLRVKVTGFEGQDMEEII